MNNELIDYDHLKSLNPSDSNYEGLVRSILRDFMFKDFYKEPTVFFRNVLEVSDPVFFEFESNIQKIRHSIINFLYSGSFLLDHNASGDYKYTGRAESVIRKNIGVDSKTEIAPSAFFKPIEESWAHVSKTYKDYLVRLKEKLTNDQNLKIDKIIVYEAPPYADGDNDLVSESYFLTNSNSVYFRTIKGCFDPNSELDPIAFLVEYGIGFFDISIASLPLSKDEIRKIWNTQPEFRIGGKQLTVVLFELGLEHFLKSVGIGKVTKHPLFAIGAPVNSSAGLFEYYSLNLLQVFSAESDASLELKFESFPNYACIVSVDLGVINTPLTYIKRKAHGETFPMFKANIINSGFPNIDLMKNAFNI